MVGPERILMIAHAFPPTIGGVEAHLYDISTRLAQRGHLVQCLVGGETFGDEVVDGVSVARRPELTVRYLLEHRNRASRDTINPVLLDRLAQILGRSIE